MLRFILTRVSLVVPTFIGITLLVFVLIRLIPGDPIETMAGERGIDPARHERLRHEYGFDQPIMVQYAHYVARGLNGDLGRRYDWRGRNGYGYFTPTREFRRGGVVCRDFTETTYRGGREYTRTGTACRQTDGNWRFD